MEELFGSGNTWDSGLCRRGVLPCRTWKRGREIDGRRAPQVGVGWITGKLSAAGTEAATDLEKSPGDTNNRQGRRGRARKISEIRSGTPLRACATPRRGWRYAAFECGQCTKAMERVRAQLEKLERRVANGRLKTPENIGAAAARILARNHGHRYYDWTYKDGVFCFFERPVHFTREQVYEGKYVIQTEEQSLSAVDAVRLYKELSEVERAFANLEDVIDMRPIYHRSDHRVEAHIFVAAMAFLIHRSIEKKLKAAHIDLSATEALTALKSVRVVDIALDGSTKRCVTRGTQRAAAVLRGLGVTDVDPPAPPQPGDTVR
jgi:hypothetical protein